jgi:hypothetical protein
MSIKETPFKKTEASGDEAYLDELLETLEEMGL